MCFALFMIMLDNTVVNVALPSIQRDLGASISGLEWTINGYTLSFAVLLATGGRLGDIFGRRRMFLVGVVIFALSSATAGFAADSTSLVDQPRRPGHRRRADDAGDALDHHQRLPAARARQGDRHLGRRLGAGAGGRPGARRLPHRARLLAGDLLHQHPGRPAARSWRALFAVRESRDWTRRPRGRLPRRRHPDGLADRAGPRPDRGQQLGLGLGRRSSPCWSASVVFLARASSRSSCGAGADGRVQAVRRPQLHRRRTWSRWSITFAMLGVVLLPRPLHAEHPRLLAARGRGPLPAGDPDDRRRRAARRPARRPRSAPAG